MHIGVDMDSVIAEIVNPLIRFHNDVYKTKNKPSDHVMFDLSPIWGCDLDETINRIDEFYRSKYFDLIKPIPGARQAISRLSKNHDLSLITARPYWLETKSIIWLNCYFPNRFKHIHHTNLAHKKSSPHKKKSEVCLDNGVEIMIEDHLEYASDIASVGIPVLLFNQPWNQTKNLPKGVERVYSWKEIRL